MNTTNSPCLRVVPPEGAAFGTDELPWLWKCTCHVQSFRTLPEKSLFSQQKPKMYKCSCSFSWPKVVAVGEKISQVMSVRSRSQESLFWLLNCCWIVLGSMGNWGCVERQAWQHRWWLKAGRAGSQGWGSSPQSSKAKPPPDSHAGVPGMSSGRGFATGSVSTTCPACFSLWSPWCQKCAGGFALLLQSPRTGTTGAACTSPSLGSPWSQEGSRSRGDGWRLNAGIDKGLYLATISMVLVHLGQYFIVPFDCCITRLYKWPVH